jgi:crotonobetainyl-CoA:carnitine CoA-transferase CaiB-like acyl-CoA transferase
MTARHRKVAPLSGIRVLDLTSFLGGPYAAMLLADLGADVIKIEAPGGDPSRNRQDVPGYSSAYAGVNRNKRSLVLDFKNTSSRLLLHRLVKGSDVMLVSIRPRSRAALGLDYKTLNKINPRLIYCSVTGYGETEAALDIPAMDTTAQAMSGLLSLIVGNFDGEVSIRAYLSDVLVGVFACNGVLAAIAARHLTGKGQEVRTSLLQASLAFELFNFFILFAAQGSGRNSAMNRPAHYVLRGSDNLPFAAHVPPSPERVWDNFAAALGMDALNEDARFSTKALRAANYSALHHLIAEHTRKTKSRAQWIKILRAREVACAPVYELSEVFRDPIVKSLGMLKTITDPWGKLRRTVGSGVDFSDTPAVEPARAPLLGEHNREILTELGLSKPEIEQFEKSGVVGNADPRVSGLKNACFSRVPRNRNRFT